MPDNLNFPLYFNIAFFAVLGLGLFFGFLKGLRKSMWSFFVTLIFYIFFFFTIDAAVNLLWTVNMPFLGGLLANVDGSLSNVTSISQALPLLLEKYLGEYIPNVLTNEHFLELVTAIALFAVKSAYT
ncbi:MAG TPA: hypothetical protein PKU69_05460, partial [Bacillota bacterium]|nr:hypothetical protein [Bacillota bacterium]